MQMMQIVANEIYTFPAKDRSHTVKLAMYPNTSYEGPTLVFPQAFNRHLNPYLQGGAPTSCVCLLMFVWTPHQLVRYGSIHQSI